MRVRLPFVLGTLQSRLRSSRIAVRRRAIPTAISVVGLVAVLGLVIYAGSTFGGARVAGAVPALSSSQSGSVVDSSTPASPVATGTITIETFGFKFGRPPRGCKFVADVRNIKAGTFSPRQNGLMASVRRRVMATAAAKRWHTVLVTTWMPNLTGGDKVAIGCTRGHHRSVALAVVFAQDLKAQGFTVKLVNRDIKKKYK